MNEYLKDRIECLKEFFPCFKEEGDKKHVSSWLKLFIFIFYHSYVMNNGEDKRPPLGEPSLKY